MSRLFFSIIGYAFVTNCIFACKSTNIRSDTELQNSSAAQKTTVTFIFDWDDNIFYMPTKVVLKDTSNQERLLSTGEFTKVRPLIGVVGEWEKYRIDDADASGTFRYMGDLSEKGDNSFIADITSAIKSDKAQKWKAPAWSEFWYAMSHQETASSSYLITGRLHQPKTINSALSELKKWSYIQNVIPTEKIWPVTYPGFAEIFQKKYGEQPPEGGGAKSPDKRKSSLIVRIIEEVNQKSAPNAGPSVLGCDGKTQVRKHLIRYSDDDEKNLKSSYDVVQEGFRLKKWSNVKIVFYDSNKDRLKQYVVCPGQARDITNTNEIYEWGVILRDSYGVKLN